MLGHFWMFDRYFAWQAQGSQHLAKREGFVAVSKTMAGVGHLKRICKDACRVAGAVQETCSSGMLGGQGADFLIEVVFSSIRSWGVTSAALFRGTRNTLDIWSGKLEKRIRTRLSPQHSAFPFLKEVLQNCIALNVESFHFWRKPHRIAVFLVLPTSKFEGSLAEKHRFSAFN